MKTFGVIGGMGPAATVDFLNKLISLTKADTDQQHVPVIADIDTRIPDRTAAILFSGENPVPELIKSARRLEHAGADILMMTCNTAHYFYDAVQAAVSVPVLSMLARLKAQGAQRFILGCTELPIAFVDYHIPGETIDPGCALARAALTAAGAGLKQ